MICPSGGFANRDGRTFCGECGQRLAICMLAQGPRYADWVDGRIAAQMVKGTAP